jgi:hypothetical protein
MNTDNKRHLTEKLLLLAIVDEDRLPVWDREHLCICPQCRTQKEKTEQHFVNWGETAKKITPLPLKRPILPPETSRESVLKALSWKPAFATALAIVLVIIVSLWTMGPEKIENIASTEDNIEIWEEEQFMVEMDLLAEIALPGEYAELISESDADFEEAFLDYIAPLADSQPLSFEWRMEGAPLC